MNKYLLIVIIVLLAVLGAMWQQVEYANNKWKVSEANVKAYSAKLSEQGKKSIALQLTANQLDYFKDSVIQKLDSVRKELNVKDRNLKALQAVYSNFTKTDTITLRDTLFRNPKLSMDTVVGDKWYSVRLSLSYPSMIAVKPDFRSEKYIVASMRKETVNPPKKFFLFRWFQKKHNVLTVDVVENNPYAYNESSRYIQVIK